MTLSELSPSEITHRLASGGLWLRVGPFTYHVCSKIRAVAHSIAYLYKDFPVDVAGPFADFHISLIGGHGMLGRMRPGAAFLMDGRAAFKGFAKKMAVPFLEWGMNWCVTQHAHQFLMLHAAVVERGGEAAIIMARSGGGKSTLTAALALNGWRLFSDELALVSPRSGDLTAIARPISLKNETINLIHKLSSAAPIGVASTGAPKGTVAHLRPPLASVRDVLQPARPRWVILLEFERDADARMAPASKPHTMIALGKNSFNYGILGRQGFHTLSDLVDRCDCFNFSYGRLADAIDTFDHLASHRTSGGTQQGAPTASTSQQLVAPARTA